MENSDHSTKLIEVVGEKYRHGDETQIGFMRRKIVGLKLVVFSAVGQPRLLINRIGVY